MLNCYVCYCMVDKYVSDLQRNRRNTSYAEDKPCNGGDGTDCQYRRQKIQDRALVNPQKGLMYSKTSEKCLNLTCVTVYILSLYYNKQDQLEIGF